MNRIVIQLGLLCGPDNSGAASVSLEEPHLLPRETKPLPCVPDDPVFQALKAATLEVDSVKFAGQRLFEALQTHRGIREYLQTALQTTGATRYPVIVEFADTSLENLPWEALCSPAGDFLGLDPRWSLARAIEPRTPAAPFYRLTPPVRIAAVLSCLGVPAQGELRALREAAREAGTGKVEILVIASEEQLILDLQAERDAGEAQEVHDVKVVPTDVPTLQRMIADFKPHVLHFFCHGSAEGKHILVARKTDWEEQLAGGASGLPAEASQFDAFRHAADDLPWLLVLNCCEGAAAEGGAQSRSLALQLAYDGFAPAVVGMREAVVSDTANVLTRTLYSRLLADLATRTEDTDTKPVDWPALVVSVREALACANEGMPLSQAAACTKEWTLPVLYIRPDEFKLQVMPPARPPLPPTVGPSPDWRGFGTAATKTAARAARLEIEALQALLAALPPDQASELKDDANRRIAELSVQLGVS